MPPRAARQRRKHFFSGRRQVEAVGAPVAVHPPAFDETTPHQILDNRSEAGFIAAIGEGQDGLADAGVAGDQGQGGETAGAFSDLLRAARKGLESGFLRHAQIEANPGTERTEIYRQAKGFTVPAASTAANAIRSVHRASLLQSGQSVHCKNLV